LLLQKARLQMYQKMLDRAGGKRVDEQIGDLFGSIYKKHHVTMKLLKNRILQNPNYFDNEYRSLKSYVNEHMEMVH
jgi:hypothetical protein